MSDSSIDCLYARIHLCVCVFVYFILNTQQIFGSDLSFQQIPKANKTSRDSKQLYDNSLLVEISNNQK